MKILIFLGSPLMCLAVIIWILNQDINIFDIFLCILVIFFLVFLLYKMVRAYIMSSKLGISFSEYLSETQESVFLVPAPIDFVFDKSRSAFDLIGAKVIASDRNSKKIDASTVINLNDFGHDISMQLVENNNYNRKVMIKSFHTANLLMVNFGRGRDNIEFIKGVLMSCAK